MSKNQFQDRRKDERKPLVTQAALLLDTYNLEGTSVNISRHGLRLDTDNPIKFKVQYDLGTGMTQREVFLVWADKKEDGKMMYGFELSPDSEGWNL